jgi:hypothetical protein
LCSRLFAELRKALVSPGNSQVCLIYHTALRRLRLSSKSCLLSRVACDVSALIGDTDPGSEWANPLIDTICIPASAQALGKFCLRNCRPLSSLAFESRSRLDRIEESAFQECLLLESLFIPASMRLISHSTVLRTS